MITVLCCISLSAAHNMNEDASETSANEHDLA